jgi:hypothetical protein
MASIQVIRDLVESYILGKVPVSEFGNGFLPHLKPALRSQDQKLKAFAFSVHAQISNHSHGLLSDQEFVKNLKSILLEHQEVAAESAGQPGRVLPTVVQPLASWSSSISGSTGSPALQKSQPFVAILVPLADREGRLAGSKARR